MAAGSGRMVPVVCPRTGRSPFRRKKNYLYLGLLCGLLLLLVQMTQYNEGYAPLRPLADATSEAKRLLQFISHHQYSCNMTIHVSNRTHWPLCLERDVGLDLDTVREQKVMYTIGSKIDFHGERDLAANHSFTVFIITHQKLPQFFDHINNTFVVKTVLVPNDPADFSRNIYGQQTMNDLMKGMGHTQLNLLRIHDTASHVNIWEILRYMVSDGLLANVQQLQVRMYIDKLDEDFLYNWYRTLHEMFYKAGMHLYHTSSADSLCLQVTMMESCAYYLSFVRNPGMYALSLHPPADYGTAQQELGRLIDYINHPQTECSQRMATVGGHMSASLASVQNLQFSPRSQSQPSPEWQLCYPLERGRTTEGGVAPKLCSIFRFRFDTDSALDQTLTQEGCKVYTLEPVGSAEVPVKMFKVYSLQSHPTSNSQSSQKLLSSSTSAEEIFHKLHQQPNIPLVEIDAPGLEWSILSQLLESGVLKNVHQLLIHLQLKDLLKGRQSMVLRYRYSQLRRLEAHGFRIFYSARSNNPLLAKLGKDCCFRVGFVKKNTYQFR